VRAYLLSRLGQTVLVVFLSLTAVFFLMRLGGDPVLLFLPMDIQAKDLTEFRERLGFNDPVAVQYGRFISRAIRGDFGESLRYKQDALGLVLERLPATLYLAVAALGLTFLVAVPVGVLSAVRRGSLFDFFGMGAAVLGQAIPGFWLGLMLIYLFSVQLGWLPTGGTGSARHFVMPCVVLASFYAARMARLTRSSVLDTLNEEFVLTARAKGLAERIVIAKHALKNSAIPIVTLAGLDTGQLLGGRARGAVYLVAEALLITRTLSLNSEGQREQDRYRELALVVARAQFAPVAEDTVFEYYEQMGRYVESGPFDIDPGPDLVPPTDERTYNGRIWLLARTTYFPDPDQPPPADSPEYQRALSFYESRAIGANFRWSWRNAGLEQDLYRQTIQASDAAFRSATTTAGLLLANHLLSAVDAFITERLSRPRRDVSIHSGFRTGGHRRRYGFAVTVSIGL